MAFNSDNLADSHAISSDDSLASIRICNIQNLAVCLLLALRFWAIVVCEPLSRGIVAEIV